MKIIITGATGSLGAFLTRWFAGKGHQIIAVGRVANPPERLHDYASYLQADITQLLNFPDADVCIHTAAIADDKANKSDLFNANVLGTRHVAFAANNCTSFIHTSSSSVYMHSDDLITEEMAGETEAGSLSAYGHSKWMAENILAESVTNQACFILRPRGIYGAGDKVLLPRLLKLVRNGKMIRPGSMEVNLSMTHFENFANAVEQCMASKKTGLHIYNVADDEKYVLYNVLKKLLTAIYSTDLPENKIPLWVFRILSALHIGDATPLFIDTVSKNHTLDLSKIKNELNYVPPMNLDIALPEIVSWVKRIGGIDVLKNAEKSLAWEY